MSTHGEGYNPVGIAIPPLFPPSNVRPRHYDFVEFNEVGGAKIFSDVDAWIQDKLINQGACPLTDD